MAEDWPQLLESWVTPELALRDWRERIARVEAQEAAHFAGLPYVKGVAVIGSVGRGTQWPLSDLDLLIAADFWEGEDPEWPIRREEAERIKRLHGAGIPNDVEAGNWVLTADDVRRAVDGDEDGFFGMLDHPHWVGIVLKAAGARVTHDFHGYLGRFLERCSGVLWSDRFVKLWLRQALDDAGERLREARDRLAEGEVAAASLGVILTAHAMTGGIYAAWRRLPESICRGVTRFLGAAEEMGEQEVGSQFLSAARLDDDEVRERFAAAPAAGRRERDVLLAIRQGHGETVDPMGAARDLLHTVLWVAETLDRSLSAPYPAWTGVTADERIVRRQLDGAEAMLGRLREAKEAVEGGREAPQRRADEADPLQGHTREWPSTPYSDEARAAEPPMETSCCIGLFGDCTVDVGMPPAMRPESHLAVRLRREFPGQPFVIRNLGDSGGTAGDLLGAGRLGQALADVPRLDIAFVRYGINDRKWDGIPRCTENVRALCRSLREKYADVAIVIETGIWVDYPRHYMFDRNARLAPLYEAMRKLAAEEGYPLVDIFEKMEAETRRSNWDLRVRGLPDPEHTILDDSFDRFFADDPAFFTNIHPNSRCLGLIADWEAAKLKELFGDRLPGAVLEEVGDGSL